MTTPSNGPRAHHTRESAESFLAELRASAADLSSRSIRDLVRVLGSVGTRFLDPDDPLRKAAEERIPEEAGLTPQMTRAVIEGMARDWTPTRLTKLVEADFPDPGVLDGFRPGPNGDLLRAVGGSLAFHVGAGSVPGVGATSLLRSLLVKCPVLLKPGRADIALATLWVRGLAERDPDLARACAVEYWPGHAGGHLEAAALRSADRVVVYGGSDTVRELRSRVPPTTPFLAYHHRWSMGAIGRERLAASTEARRIAAAAATAVATFDQRGCVSPQVIWVEEGGRTTAGEWARALAEELEALETSLPPGPVDAATAATVQQLRGTAELRAATGTGDRVFAGSGVGWTVLYETDPRPAPSCLSRTVRVKPIERLEHLSELLEPHAATLQSFALEASDERRRTVGEALGRAGVTRITSFRRQPWPPAWWRHDGSGPLQALVRWISLEEPEEPRRENP